MQAVESECSAKIEALAEDMDRTATQIKQDTEGKIHIQFCIFKIVFKFCHTFESKAKAFVFFLVKIKAVIDKVKQM